MPQSKNSQAQAQARAVLQSIYEARNNPYVRRLLEDEELRTTIRGAFASAQDAYKRVQKAKTPKKAMDDKKFQRDLAQAVEALRDAGSTLRESPKKGGHGVAKLLIVGALVAIAALAASANLREKVLDMLFGAEEEFDYMSTTNSDPVSSGPGSSL